MDVNQIISKLGGIRPTANKIGVAVSTVQGWKERGKIPTDRIPEIEKILGESINADETPQQPVKTEIQKTAKIDKNSPKIVKNNQKTAKNVNFLTFLSLGVSITALGLAVTADLWRGYVFPQVDKIAKIEEKVAKIDEKALKIEENGQNQLILSQTAYEKYQQIEANVTANKEQIATNSAKVNQMLEINNERLIKVRQVITLALTGANFSMLLNDFNVNTDDEKQALAVLKQNQSGILTKIQLMDFVNRNALELASSINGASAKTVWEKVKAKINNAIYIRSKNEPKNDVITKLIFTINTDDLDTAIAITDGVDGVSYELNQYLKNRKDTIIALTVLNGWATK